VTQLNAPPSPSLGRYLPLTTLEPADKTYIATSTRNYMDQHYDINWLIDKYEKGDNLKYVFFWGHVNRYNEDVGKFCFSQWFECPFVVDNISYKTTEHWMMAKKALLFGDSNTFDKIIKSNSPREAKELGRQVSGYDDHTWNTEKFDIVKFGNIHKFSQHPKFADYLLQTENKVLVEASPTDIIWGIGLSRDSKDIENIYAWRGLNLLGFALMEVRDILRHSNNSKSLNKKKKQ
jgi:ribA/ribD-fused uncharacterized protein